MFDISSLLPKDEYINQRKRAAQLVKKWQPTGLLEGLRGANVGNMAQLLENLEVQDYTILTITREK